MTEGIKGSAYFRCSNCKCRHVLRSRDFDLEAVGGSDRGMGEEIQYAADVDIECDECGQEIHLHFDVWEYPVGAINYSDHSETGAIDVDCEFEIEHAPEEPEHDDSRVLSAAAGGAIFGASVGGPLGALVGAVAGALMGDAVNKSKKGGGDG